jgi:uncharacterized membrane protein YqjE
VTDSGSGDGHRPGLLASIQRLVATFVEILQTRVEIVSTEFEEERERIRELVVYSILTLFFAGTGALLLTLYVVILYWDTHRLNVVGGFALLYLGLGIVAGVILRRRLKARPRLFASTLSELEKDRERLREGAPRR